jgi:hypothetical protein
VVLALAFCGTLLVAPLVRGLCFVAQLALPGRLRGAARVCASFYALEVLLAVTLVAVSAEGLTGEMINTHTFPLCVELNEMLHEPFCLGCQMELLWGFAAMAGAVVLHCVTVGLDTVL